MQEPFDITADLDTPVSTYLKLGPLQPRFLLESVEGGSQLGRYSFLGFGDALQLRLDSAGLQLNETTQSIPETREELLRSFREALKLAPRLSPDIAHLPFTGGLVGVSGYDLVRFFEHLPRGERANDGTPAPEAAYIATRSVLVFDHLTRRIALLHDGTEAERRNLRAEVKRLLHGSLPETPEDGNYSRAQPSFSKKSFMQAVEKAKQYITSGDVYQLVLSIRFSGLHQLSPFQTYRALRLLNPSPYMYFLELDDLQVVGSSPEALVRLYGRRAWLRPIAGTRPRGTSPEEDAAHETSLRADEKENAEHVMLVDLARNDLGRVATAGSVRVDPYRSIEKYSHVMHIVSGVTGELDDGRDAFDLFSAAFPAGTLVGAPKVRAMQLIDELEPVSRGLYAGTAGYFGSGGDMDQAITIRTLVFQGDTYSYQAGAGIVADSDPESEYYEVMAKSEILRRALSIAEEGL